MKSLLILVAALVFAASPAAIALTVEEDVTPEYVRSHAKEFSVKVAKDKNGLIAFTVVFTLPEPRYVIAHLVVRSGDRVLAESVTPAFTKNSENTFHFSVPPECLSTSDFNLSAGGFAISGGAAVPLPGTIVYRFRLPNFALAVDTKSGTADSQPDSAFAAVEGVWVYEKITSAGQTVHNGQLHSMTVGSDPPNPGTAAFKAIRERLNKTLAAAAGGGEK